MVKQSYMLLKNIKHNLFFAFIYNIVGIPIFVIIFLPYLYNIIIECSNDKILGGRALYTLKIKQKNLLCHHCLMNVAKSLDNINGILEFEIDLEEQAIMVKCANEDLSKKQIRKVINASIITGKIPIELIGEDFIKGTEVS